MRRAALLSFVFCLLAVAPASAAVTTLRLDGIGPLTLGMSRTAAVGTGWLSDRSAGCELASPRPIVYQLRGGKAPSGLRGSVEFSGGKLTNVSVTRGAKTALGIRPNVSTPAGMVRAYRRAGFSAKATFEETFQATFVTVQKNGEQVLSGFATGKRLSVLSLPFTSTCE